MILGPEKGQEPEVAKHSLSFEINSRQTQNPGTSQVLGERPGRWETAGMHREELPKNIPIKCSQTSIKNTEQCLMLK